MEPGMVFISVAVGGASKPGPYDLSPAHFPAWGAYTLHDLVCWVGSVSCRWILHNIKQREYGTWMTRS